MQDLRRQPGLGLWRLESNSSLVIQLRNVVCLAICDGGNPYRTNDVTAVASMIYLSLLEL